MNDTELYTYFKNQSETFNEMPSAEFWEKITLHLDHAPKKMVSKPTIAKLFLLVAAIIAGSLYMANQDQEPQNENQTLQPKKPANLVQYPVTETKKDEQKTKTSVPMPFKRRAVSKIPTNATVYFALNAPLKKDSVGVQYAPIGKDTLFHLPKSKKILTETPIVLEDSQVLNASNRIVVTSSKKLTSLEFDKLVERAITASKTAHGKLLIVKAVGHKPYKSFIFGPKNDTILNPAFKTSILQGIFLKDSVK